MPSVMELKERRGARIDAMRGIVAKAEAEKRELNPKEVEAFDAAKAEIQALEKDIARGEFLAEAERRMQGEPVANADARFETMCRDFNLLRAIRSQIPGMHIDAGREIEISKEIERRSGRQAQGIFCPMEVFEKRVVTTALPAAGPGSNIISTDLLAGQFIDVLRDNMIVRRLGARVINGLIGNVEIPRLKASATGYWVAENAAVTASDVQFDQVALSPKHAGALTEVSRNMLLQSTPDIEGILRDDFAALLARALDRVAIKGGGTSEPSGILVNSGCTDVTGASGNGLAPTWANVLACISNVELSNALAGSLGFATNGKVAAKMATILKSTGDTSSNFIIPDLGSNTLAGYPMARSNQVPSDLTKGTGTALSALIFGNWSDLIIGTWSAFDLLVNPYDGTAYPKGNVLLRAMMTVDVAIRQPKSFAFLDDIITT